MDDIQAHKAKKTLKRRLKKHNWVLQDFDPNSKIAITAYCYEPFDSQELAMCGLTSRDIELMSNIDEAIEVISGSVGHAFQQYLAAMSKQLKKRTEELVILLELYMVNTSTYQQLINRKQEGKHLHFIVLLYRNKYTEEVNMRPFSLLSDKQVLSIDEIKSYAASVIGRDEKINPGFFNSSPVVPITEFGDHPGRTINGYPRD